MQLLATISQKNCIMKHKPVEHV